MAGGLMKRSNALLVLSAAIMSTFLSSCVHYRARPLNPAQSQAAFQARSLTNPGLATFIATQHPGTPWPPKQLNLADAALIAAYFNPALQIAQARIRTAEAVMVTAGARPNPVASSAGGYETALGSPLIFRFQLSLPIETARKRGYRILEAAKLAEAARIALHEASWQVYSQVRDAWANHLSSMDVAEALRRESQIRTQVVSLMQARLSAGESSRTERDNARNQAIAADVALHAAEAKVVDARIRIASSLGMPASALEGIPLSQGSGSPQPIENLPIARVQEKGLLNRLDVRRSLLEYAATEARLQLEIARQYPDIELNPGYDFEEGYHKFTFGPTLPMPIWNRNRGPIAEAQAGRLEAEARFLALQSQVIAELERSLAAYSAALSEFAEADQKWSTLQASRERATLHAVQLGEEDQLALTAIRLEGTAVFNARVNALAKARTAFSALEDAVQAPLDNVPWIKLVPTAPQLKEHQ